MPCVVGLAHQGCVYMGADSAETDIHGLMLRRDHQVIWKDPFLIGVPGSHRLGNLVRSRLGPHAYTPEIDLRTFIVEHVANEVLAWIHAEPALHRLKEATRGASNPDFHAWDGLLLVGCCGRLFTIGSDCQVVEPLNGYDALGTGDDVALGALYATQSEADPVQRVDKALRAAERLSGHVRSPFYVWCLESSGECEEGQSAHQPS